MVWHLKEANWKRLSYELRNVDWKILDENNVNEAADLFQTILLGLCRCNIPWRKVTEEKRNARQDEGAE